MGHFQCNKFKNQQSLKVTTKRKSSTLKIKRPKFSSDLDYKETHPMDFLFSFNDKPEKNNIYLNSSDKMISSFLSANCKNGEDLHICLRKDKGDTRPECQPEYVDQVCILYA